MSCAHFCVDADEAPEALSAALFSLLIEEATFNGLLTIVLVMFLYLKKEFGRRNVA
jgi:hypothetical protein